MTSLSSEKNKGGPSYRSSQDTEYGESFKQLFLTIRTVFEYFIVDS